MTGRRNDDAEGRDSLGIVRRIEVSESDLGSVT